MAVESENFQPRLNTWSHVWRAAVVIAISGLAWWEVAGWQWNHHRLWFFLDLGLGLTAFALTRWRRRYPLTIALVTAALTAVSGSAAGPATLALVSLATRRRWRELVPAAIVSASSAAVFAHLNPTDNSDGVAVFISVLLLFVGVSVGWGMYLGSRRELLGALRDRAERAESEQSLRIVQARAAERSRIAREMHDVLAHRISLVTMHAGALAYRTDLSNEEVTKSATIIQENAHRALTDLREVLGVLRDDERDGGSDRPQPSIADLSCLVDEARAAGMNVKLLNLLAADSLSETIGRTVYRIVQEGLTNARKHAPDTAVQIFVEGSPIDGVHVAIRNPRRVGDRIENSPRSGLGLIGLAERTELVGGTLEHYLSDQGDFELRAWLPWTS